MNEQQLRLEDEAKRALKSELKYADVSYRELARRLTEMGLPETEGSVAVKIGRGTFPAWFLLAVMKALRAKTLTIDPEGVRLGR